MIGYVRLGYLIHSPKGIAMMYAYSVRVVFDRALNHEDDTAGTPATSDAFTHEVEAENAVCALAAAVEGVHHQYHRVGRRFLSLNALKASLTLAEVNRLDETPAP